MLHGNGTMIVKEVEIVHALNVYFDHCVVDKFNTVHANPYARITGVRQRKCGEFEIYMQGQVEKEE